VVKRTVNMHDKVATEVAAVGEEAPGQAVTHYAPDVKCYMIRSISHESSSQSSDNSQEDKLLMSNESLKSGAVMIDFGGQFFSMKDFFLAYRDLSSSSSSLEAAQALFDTLRWTEQVQGATMVLVAPIAASLCSSEQISTSRGSDERECIKESDEEALDLSLGLADRVFRAASGVAVDIVVCN